MSILRSIPKVFLPSLCLLFLTVVSWAGVEWGLINDGLGANATINVYKADITASTAGAASGVLNSAGEIVQIAVVPKPTRLYINTTTLTTNNIFPAAAWDCTLADQYGADLSGGQLTNLLATTDQKLFPRLHTTIEPPFRGPLTLSCTSMGTTTKAEIHVYIRQQ